MESETDICNVCKTPLVSAVNNSREDIILNCYYCKKEFKPSIYCPNAHYVCDTCHSKNANEIIQEYCLNTKKTDPFEMINEIMTHPKFNMGGPEHHVLITMVLLTMLRNLGIKYKNTDSLTNADLKTGFKRATTIPGGSCGFFGSCGAATGAGIAISVFTHGTPSKNTERSLAIDTTSNALKNIADDIEHCCKRSVYYGINSALQTLEMITDYKFDFHAKRCIFSPSNPKCEKQKCPVFILL